ncbi:hypothetical protein ABKV19_008833, partial [Rosa sericea]
GGGFRIEETGAVEGDRRYYTVGIERAGEEVSPRYLLIDLESFAVEGVLFVLDLGIRVIDWKRFKVVCKRQFQAYPSQSVSAKACSEVEALILLNPKGSHACYWNLISGMKNQQLIDHGHQIRDETDQAIDRAQRFFIRLSTGDYDFDNAFGVLCSIC